MNIIEQILAASVVVLVLTQSARADDTKPQVIEKWGKVVDPDRDCKFSVNGKGLTITVPGTLHDLNKRNKMNAPRVLEAVEGDFEITVKVSGKFNPGPKSTISENNVRFTSGGLLLWHDERNYIRLERNTMVRGSSAYCFPPLCEIFSDGKYKGINKPATTVDYFTGESTWLRLKREGDYFMPAISHDGKTWEELKKIELLFPDKVMVGVSAINTGNEPHSVTFDKIQMKKE